MPGNTTRRFPNDRRASKRVPVLFSALLNRKGWRSQVVEVFDLSETGAKVMLQFAVPDGAEVVLRVPGAKGKLGVPAVVANGSMDTGRPVAGLRFSVTDEIRSELREIVDRVDRSQRRGARANETATPVVPVPVVAPRGGTRVTRRTKTKSKPKPDRSTGRADGVA
ncbi:MAG: PilZ domain-containing protein [Planctomycetes bacterium]|nr:PilZ domain-containing protein [Planctomycetota bacterium]